MVQPPNPPINLPPPPPWAVPQGGQPPPPAPLPAPQQPAVPIALPHVQLAVAEPRYDALADQLGQAYLGAAGQALNQRMGGLEVVPAGGQQAVMVAPPQPDPRVNALEAQVQLLRDAHIRGPRSRSWLYAGISAVAGTLIIACIVGVFLSLLNSKDVEHRFDKGETKMATVEARVDKNETDVVNLALGVNQAVSDLRVADARQEAKITAVETTQQQMSAAARARAKSVDDVLAELKSDHDIVKKQLTDTGDSLSRLSNMTARIQEVEARAARHDTMLDNQGRRIGGHDRLHPRTITAVPVGR